MTPEQRTNLVEWLAALRSGQYTQGNGNLRDTNDKYCCLGVAAKIAEVPCIAEEPEGAYTFSFPNQSACRHSYEWESQCLPSNSWFEDRFGLKNGLMDIVARMNDGSLEFRKGMISSFSEIADFIELNAHEWRLDKKPQAEEQNPS